MCDDIVKCIETDTRIREWVLDTTRSDVQLNVWNRLLAVITILLSKYSEDITNAIKDII